MKNLNGIIFGAILGFIFLITWKSPLTSNFNKTTAGCKYQISTGMIGSLYYEVIMGTETGQVIDRQRTSTGMDDTVFLEMFSLF